MKLRTSVLFLLMMMVSFTGYSGSVEAEKSMSAAVEPTADEHAAELEAMCTGAADAMTARQAEKSLYDRVGGREGINAVVADTVARHLVNEKISHLMEGVDADHLIKQVTDFLVVGTGGEGEYTGRSMADAHAHMGLSNVEFLAAGNDLGESMKAAGWGENEIQEVLCAFVGLRGEVVTR